MSVDNELDLNTLSWVKSELDETLNQARSSLEVYVEDEADETQLQFVKNYLHQVYGTLQMVELYGASLAAEEMEKLTEGLLEGKVGNRNDAYEVLMRGILQLPDYLDQLLAGHHDMPMVLLPLLNDMRAARGEALLSENALFNPDLAVKAPVNEAITGENISDLARKLRHHYHLGLLGWFRDQDSDASLERIARVIDTLRESATEEEINRLLWVAGGLVESLRQGGLDSNVSIKLLLGQLDRQFKKIIDKGVTALSSEPPSELLKNLLYYVASSRSDGELTREIKDAFNLQDILPDTGTLERARADLTGPNAQLMHTVSSVLLEDLTRVKDELDLFVRADERHIDQLKPLCATLKQMGDTLGMLGLGVQRNVINEQHDILEAMVSGEREVDDNTLMDMAGAMLSIENSLGEMATARAANEEYDESHDKAKSAERLQGVERQKLLKTVIEQAKIELSKAKESLSDFSRKPASRDLLEGVPRIIEQIRGSILILDLERAADQLDRINTYTRQLRDGAVTADEDNLEHLADAISSIEYYLESLAGKWGNPDAILEVAEQSLGKLDLGGAAAASSAPASAAAPADNTQPDLAVPEDLDGGPVDEDTLVDLPAPAEQSGQFELDEGTDEAAEDAGEEDSLTLQLEEPDWEERQQATSADDTLNDLQQEEVTLDSSLPESADEDDDSQSVVLETLDDLSVDFDNLDDIGLEAGEGEAETAAGEPPGYDLSLDEQSAEFDLGEELNVAPIPEPAEPGLAGDAEAGGPAEPEPAETPEAGEPAGLELAEAPESGEPAEPAGEEPGELTGPAESEAGVAREPASAPVMDEVDDEILEIFMEEAEEEHANIRELLPRWVNNPQDEQALKDLRRSFHTLKGSGRLVGASDVGEFAWAFENMLNRVIDQTIESSPEMFRVLEQAEQALPELFEHFRRAEHPAQKIFTLIEQADALRQGLPVNLEEAPSEAPPPAEAGEPAAGQAEQAEATAETVPAEATDAAPAPEVEEEDEAGIDPVLLDIYRKEVETHLATLQKYIQDWHDNVDRSASNELLRALHTLTGSSRTTGITGVSELCGLYEKYVKELQQYHQSLDPTAVGVLEELHGYVNQVLELLATPGSELPDGSQLMASIQSLLDNFVPPDSSASLQQLQQPASEPEPEPEMPAAQGKPADYDEELLEIFIEEGEEILEQSDDTLLQWRDDPDNHELIESLQRQLHTLKGGARMAGVVEIGDLGHSIESMLTAVVDGHAPVSQPMFGLMQRAQDRLVGMLEQVKNSERPAPGDDLIAEVDNLLARARSGGEELTGAEEAQTATTPEEEASAAEAGEPATPTEDDDVIALEEGPAVELVEVEPETETDTTIEPATADTQAPQEDDGDGSRDRRKASRVQHEQVRVRADLLDNLVNFAGEVSIYRSRMEQQTNAFRFNLQELDDTVSRLREQLRQFEIEAETQIQFKKEERVGQGFEDFDPLEFDRFTQMQHLSRAMMESLNDLDSIKGILSNVTRESETLLLQQSRVNTELQEGLMRTRMVPFSGQAPRLRRIVRQTADEMGKQVELQLQGVEAELDRQVLERIIPPIEHMLRNAVAHGIETPDQRQQAGKPAGGTINMAISREGSDIIIRVDDDGRGIDLQAIHKKAIQRGLLKPDEKVTRETLLNMIMQSGFSTAEQVTQVAGRGVGMDVVNSEIKQLGGLLEIDTREGKGTSFIISLPLTLAISRALMVYVGDELYAVPLLNVQGVERIRNSELRELLQSEDPVYHWVNEDYRIMHLGNLLGGNIPAVPDDDERVPLLLVRSGDYRAAIRVEGLMGSREIVVKPVGPQLSTLRGISGATIMGDGGVVLILDLAVLVRLAAVQSEEEVIDVTPEAVPEAQARPVVMVVDDSITVRKVTSRLLERYGYEVIQAKDGVDALGQLQESLPDVMLLDVEMPRMDGYELAANMRGDERTQDVPIIMITSRTGQKHRQRAFDVGANIYMGKPYNDTTLLENIQSLIGDRVGAG